MSFLSRGWNVEDVQDVVGSELVVGHESMDEVGLMSNISTDLTSLYASAMNLTSMPTTGINVMNCQKRTKRNRIYASILAS